VSEQLHLDWSAIRAKAGPFSQEAFHFVRQGLAHTVKFVHGESEEAPEPARPDRHVSGQQLCLGLRDFALQQYGMLAKTVLSRWGIHKTEDFGRIVFAMIDSGLMRRSDEDTLEDFRGVYDFDEAFAAPGDN
jgi:uncharacterized repeat protein (TIGR04138 family)